MDLWDSVSTVMNEGGTGRVLKADIPFSTMLWLSQTAPAQTWDKRVGVADNVL